MQGFPPIPNFPSYYDPHACLEYWCAFSYNLSIRATVHHATCGLGRHGQTASMTPIPFTIPHSKPIPTTPTLNLAAVRSFCHAFWEMETIKDRQKFSQVRTSHDNHSTGRAVWHRWAGSIVKEASLNKLWDAQLQAHGRLPHNIMGPDRKVSPDL